MLSLQSAALEHTRSHEMPQAMRDASRTCNAVTFTRPTTPQSTRNRPPRRPRCLGSDCSPIRRVTPFFSHPPHCALEFLRLVHHCRHCGRGRAHRRLALPCPLCVSPCKRRRIRVSPSPRRLRPVTCSAEARARAADPRASGIPAPGPRRHSACPWNDGRRRAANFLLFVAILRSNSHINTVTVEMFTPPHADTIGARLWPACLPPRPTAHASRLRASVALHAWSAQLHPSTRR